MLEKLTTVAAVDFVGEILSAVALCFFAVGFRIAEALVGEGAVLGYHCILQPTDPHCQSKPVSSELILAMALVVVVRVLAFALERSIMMRCIETEKHLHAWAVLAKLFSGSYRFLCWGVVTVLGVLLITGSSTLSFSENRLRWDEEGDREMGGWVLEGGGVGEGEEGITNIINCTGVLYAP